MNAVPLKKPDGKIISYACAICDEIAKKRNDANDCCKCTTCDKVNDNKVQSLKDRKYGWQPRCSECMKDDIDKLATSQLIKMKNIYIEHYPPRSKKWMAWCGMCVISEKFNGRGNTPEAALADLMKKREALNKEVAINTEIKLPVEPK